MKPSQIDVDGIMTSLGDSKFFHMTQYIMLCIPVLIVSTNSFFYVYFATTPEYRCNNLTEFQLSQYNISINEEVNLLYDKCSIDITNTDGEVTGENRTLDCLNGYYYTTPVDKSIVSQWDLVCNKEGLAESTQIFYIVGQMISGLISPYLIERFGRKPVRVSSSALLIIFNLFGAFSPFYYLFAAMRFFIGILREAFLLSSTTLVCELYPKEKRIIMSGIFMNVWSFSNCLVGFIAYMLKDYNWNALFLFNAALSGYFIVDFIFLQESVRWLIATSKMKAAEKIVKKAAKQNKVDFDTIWHITLKDISTSTQQTASPVNETNLDGRNCESNVEANAKAVVNQSQLEVEKQAPMLEKLIVIFKSPYLRKVTIVMSIVWAVDLTSSNSIMLMSEAFGESVYIVYPTICLLEILTNSLYAFSAKRFGHKITLECFKTFSAACVITASLIKLLAEQDETMKYVCLVLFVVTGSTLNGACSGDIIYISELFPTEIRSAGTGFATIFIRIVGLSSPYFRLLILNIPWAPGVIIGTGCIISSILLHIYLPETGNRALPQKIEDVI
ncbi:solute carrier family 22 member 8-like isoform X2 [Octopus sinensis]|uniref:Solute carrier family 22 member 8-like isoform X2 n=1 Tax=Octopus sinensis TaxID=2607531 RepID=A0A6P7SYT4_9MOLL|nr:solute carrier family 22 member 8-like isoform X2 [Octopus sinensis]XP_036363280.1 solute carrier family 22 member 8-like isoform X2 [Octopus sinensis]